VQGVEPVTPALVGVVIGREKVDGVLSTLLDADDSPELEVLPIPVPIVDVLIGEERLELDMPGRPEFEGLELQRLELDSRLVPPAMLELPLTPDKDEDESPVGDTVDELGRVAEIGGLALANDTVDVKGEFEEPPIPLTDVLNDVPLPGMHGLGVVVDTGGLFMGGIGLGLV
jgi:hypothetical protein